jgi:hypothetical protein
VSAPGREPCRSGSGSARGLSSVNLADAGVLVINAEPSDSLVPYLFRRGMATSLRAWPILLAAPGSCWFAMAGGPGVKGRGALAERRPRGGRP